MGNGGIYPDEQKQEEPVRNCHKCLLSSCIKNQDPPLSLSGFFNSIKNWIRFTKFMCRLNSLKVFDNSYFLNIEKINSKHVNILNGVFLSYCISYFTTVEFTLFVVKNMLIRGGVTLWVTGLLQNNHIANTLRGCKFVGKGIPENLPNLTPPSHSKNDD